MGKAPAGGDWAVCFLNRSVTARTARFDWKKEHITDTIVVQSLDAGSHRYILKDLWSGKTLGNTEQPFAGEVRGHDVVLLRLH